jgi:hypothetical protein
MNITVKEALQLKGQLKEMVTQSLRELGNSRVVSTFEEDSTGKETNITDQSLPMFQAALETWEKLQGHYVELECAILKHNAQSNITYLVRMRKVAETKKSYLEGRMAQLVERRVRSTNTFSTRTEESNKWTITRPDYQKAVFKDALKKVKAFLRESQAEIESSDSQTITLSFSYEDLD